MENLREILTNLRSKDFENKKIDLHIHTKHSDGEGDAQQILLSAKNKGYKYIAITDHNTVEVHKNVKDEILLTGVEFDCWYRYVFIHLLAYGVDINNEKLQTFLAKDKSETESCLKRLFSKRNVPELIDAIHDAGGVAVLAHPACYWAISLKNLVKNLMKIGLDGIEAYYPYPRFRKIVKFHSAKDVLKIAQEFPQLIKTGGTDFHGEIF